MKSRLVLATLCLFLNIAHAADKAPASASAQATASETAAQETPSIPWKAAPGQIALEDQAILRVPAGYKYLEGAEARKALHSMGNPNVEGVLAMIGDASGDWFAVVEFDKAGYIKDDDARDWKVDELLESIKKGTEQSNEERRKSGIPEMEIQGWIEKPNYDASSHRLIWSISAYDKGGDPKNSNINYNTYALGRDGYMTVNLVTDLDKIERYKPNARALLAALEFKDGKKYSDFNASTDRVAEYGLAALVAGVAAKKLGLLALAGAFLLKFAKIILLGLAGFGATLGKFFKRKKD